MLPPRVVGKSRGFVEIVAETLKLVRNVSSVIDNGCFIIQFQWWGQDKPICLSPKIISIGSESDVNKKNSRTWPPCVSFTIKAHQIIFESYLNNQDRMEFVLLTEKKEDYDVIGAAIVKDLAVTVLSSKQEVVPIYNHFGNKIGDLTLQFRCQMKEPHDEKFLNVESPRSFLVKRTTDPPPSEVSKGFEREPETAESIGQIETLLMFPTKEVCEDNSTVLSYRSQTNQQHREPVVPPLDLSGIIKTDRPTHRCKYLPRATQKSESPKSSRKVSQNVSVLSRKLLSPSKGMTTKEWTVKDIKQLTKKHESPKNLSERLLSVPPKHEGLVVRESAVRDVEDDCGLKTVSEKVSVLSESVLSPLRNKGMVFKELAVKENVKKKKIIGGSTVVDYLLGKDMNESIEKEALEMFVEMSPCQNIVETVADLSKRFPGTHRKVDTDFDLNNPVERSYFEMFYVRQNSVPRQSKTPIHKRDLSRRLNSNIQVSTKCESENRRYNETSEDVLEVLDILNDSQCDTAPTKQCLNPRHETNKATNCARCKYYKKLEDLDAIIESLKVFERRMLSIDKEKETKDKVARVS